MNTAEPTYTQRSTYLSTCTNVFSSGSTLRRTINRTICGRSVIASLQEIIIRSLLLSDRPAIEIMGNICCDSADERSKSSAFSPYKIRGSAVTGVKEDTKPYSSATLRSSGESGGIPDHSTNGATSSSKLQQDQVAAEVERKRREEQIRLDRIVSSTGRDMVALYGRDGGSTGFRSKSQGQMWPGGSVAYYDSAYAVATARDMIRSEGLSRDLHSLYDETESGEHLDERRKKLLDILRGRPPTSLPPDEVETVESSTKRIDWRELLRDLIPNNFMKSTSRMDMFLDDETQVLFQGLEPLVENLP